jgi:hypothetical protein
LAKEELDRLTLVNEKAKPFLEGTRRQDMKAAQAEFAKYNPNREQWSEEILRDRRRELEAEQLKP